MVSHAASAHESHDVEESQNTDEPQWHSNYDLGGEITSIQDGLLTKYKRHAATANCDSTKTQRPHLEVQKHQQKWHMNYN